MYDVWWSIQFLSNIHDFAMKFSTYLSLKNNMKHDPKLTNFRYKEEGLQCFIWYENHVSYSYMGESGLEWLGVGPKKWYLILLFVIFFGKWVGVEAMNGELKDLLIDNKL